LPCPKLCSLSAGLSEICTAIRVISAAIKSSKECSASDRIPRLHVDIPITSLKAIKNIAAITDKSAIFFFSMIALLSRFIRFAVISITSILRKIFTPYFTGRAEMQYIKIMKLP
jgi:hypothetical protein